MWIYPRSGFEDFLRGPVVLGEDGLELDIELQALATAPLRGRMVDAAGAPVPGLTLWARSVKSLGGVVAVRGGADGRFEAEAVPVGELLFETRSQPRFAVRGLRHDAESPGEHSLVFLEDDTCLCLLRRDAGTFTAQLGRSRPPYRAWTWRDLSVRVGGPHLIRLPDGRIVAGTRLHEGGVRTALCRLDPEAATLNEILALPSGGDTSYPGFVRHDGVLWVSYYSSHEEKTCVYLARLRL